MEIESVYLDLGLQECQIAPRVPFIFSPISVSPFLNAGLAVGTPGSSLCGPGTKILLGIIQLFTFYIEHFLFFPQQRKSSLRGVRVLALKYILVIPLYIKCSFLETASDMVFSVLSAGLIWKPILLPNAACGWPPEVLPCLPHQVQFRSCLPQGDRLSSSCFISFPFTFRDISFEYLNFSVTTALFATHRFCYGIFSLSFN